MDITGIVIGAAAGTQLAGHAIDHAGHYRAASATLWRWIVRNGAYADPNALDRIEAAEHARNEDTQCRTSL